MEAIEQIPVKTVDGQSSSLGAYAGKVRLVVNVASKCGLTPQYEALEAVYRKYNAQGFEVLAFPANEFGAQEPGTEAEIKDFCSTKYDVTFPLLVDRKGVVVERFSPDVPPDAPVVIAALERELGR